MENNELEEMRAQLALLNEKLEREYIVNEKLTNVALETKTRIINTDKYLTLIIDGLCLIFGPVLIWVLRQYNFPIWLGVYMIVYTALDFIAQFLLYNKLNLNEITSENIACSIKRLRDFKKKHRILIMLEGMLSAIGLFFLYVWALQILSKQASVLAIISGALVIIGGVLIVSFSQKKVYSACDEIIEQLEEKE